MHPTPWPWRLSPHPLALWLAGALCLAGFADLHAAARRTQTIDLEPGWNAVFLHVEPLDTSPAGLFAQHPVDVVAGFFPEEDRQWATWYAPAREDAFLGTLHAIHGQRAYLIHATAAFSWRLRGRVLVHRIRWQADTYNLVGFPLAKQHPPSFARLFAGSGAHRRLRIRRLVAGRWRALDDPHGAAPRPGEAFWIHCDGPSDFQGPLTVETSPVGLRLDSGAQALTLRNHSDAPLGLQVEHLPVDAHPLPLSLLIRAVDPADGAMRTVAVAQPQGPWHQPLPPLQPGGAIRLPLEARLEAMGRATQVSLLKITTDLGTVAWIPVSATREDLR